MQADGQADRTWGLVEALLGWLISYLFATVFLVAFLAWGEWTVFAPSRPGGHIGRAVGQLAEGQMLVDDTLPITWLVVSFLPQWIGLLGGCWVFAMAMGRGNPGWNLSIKPEDVGNGLLTGVGMQLVLIPALYLVIHAIFDLQPSGRSLRLIDRVDGPFEAMLLVIAVGVGAPLVEELFYRGVVQRNLVERFGGPTGVVLGSLVFAAVHLQAYEFPALTVAGLGFGLLAWKAGRLGPAIIAHVAFNCVTLLVLLT